MFSVSWPGFKNRLGKMLLWNSGKLLILVLAAQLTAAQAPGSNTNKNDISLETNATEVSLFTVEEKVMQNFVTNTSLGFKIFSANIKDWSPKSNNTEYVKNYAAVFENQCYANNTKRVLTLPNNPSDIFGIANHSHPVEIGDKSRQEILLQFDKINVDIQEIKKMFDTGKQSVKLTPNYSVLSRVVRSPFVRRTQCNVSIDKLTELNNVINNALSNANGSQTRDSNCEVSNNSDNCQELVKLIQCGVNHLQSGFIKATADKASFGEFVKLKNSFDDLSKKYANVLDDARMSVSQEYQREVDKLKTDQQDLSNSLNRIIIELKEKKIVFCISEIHSGRFDSAVSSFNDLNDDNLLSDIIEKSYNYLSDTEKYNRDKKLENFDNIEEFVRKLPSINQAAVAFTALFKIIKSNNHLCGPKMLILSDLAQEYLNMPDYINIALKGCFDTIISIWATSIRSGSYAQIKSFTEKPGKYIESVNKHLPIIIKAAYSNNLNNAEKILKFIRDLHYIQHNIIALSSLFENMKINNHLNSYQLVMLAFRVKELMDMGNYHNVLQSYKDKFTVLKINLPSSVVGLVWSSRNSCTIKNSHYGEYLYTSKDYYNKVFTWVPGNTVTQSYWEIQSSDNGKSFGIKNTLYHRYLYWSAGSNNGEFRDLFTKEDSFALYNNVGWRLIPENGKFLILSDHYKEYLFANANLYCALRNVNVFKSFFAPYDCVNRRKVNTWILASIPDPVKKEIKWYIHC